MPSPLAFLRKVWYIACGKGRGTVLPEGDRSRIPRLAGWKKEKIVLTLVGRNLYSKGAFCALIVCRRGEKITVSALLRIKEKIWQV